MRLVQIIADYAPGDLAFAEIVGRLVRFAPDNVRWHNTTVESFNTVATGFLVAQLGLAEEVAEKTVIYANCAPRKDRLSARDKNEGEGLLFARSRTGVPLLVVNSGYSLSFIREDLSELWQLETPRDGSQFRSRDIFPEYVGRLLHNDLSFLQKELDPTSVIPAPPTARIGYIDSFGNLKTTLRQGDSHTASLEDGSRVFITINGIRRAATVAGGSFHVDEGDIAFAPGSSGFDRPFWEIFQRGGSACQTFGDPRAGAPIEIETLVPDARPLATQR